MSEKDEDLLNCIKELIFAVEHLRSEIAEIKTELFREPKVYNRISDDEGEVIKDMLEDGLGYAEIGRRLNRDRSTIYHYATKIAAKQGQ